MRTTPEQHGSASLKSLLSPLTGRSYDGLEIQEGGQASSEFLRVHFGAVPEAERQKVRGQLERYCGQDTEGMVWIIEALGKLADTGTNTSFSFKLLRGTPELWEAGRFFMRCADDARF